MMIIFVRKKAVGNASDYSGYRKESEPAQVVVETKNIGVATSAPAISDIV